MRALALSLLAVPLLAAPPAAAGPFDPPGRAAATPLIRTTVDLTRPGPRIPREFLGISLDYTQLTRWFGWPVPNEPYAALMRRLGARGLGSPTLRLGGDSTEETWAGPGETNPPGVATRLTPALLGRLAADMRRARSRVIAGINVGYPGTRLHAFEAKAIADALGPDRLLALELGNEPAFYPVRHYYTRKDGSQATVRPAGWGPAEYVEEMAKVTADIRAAGVSAPIAGPATDFRTEWLAAMPPLASRLGSDLGSLTFHEYPLTRCPVPGADPPRRIADDGTLTETAIRLREVVQRAAEAGMAGRLRLTETNSASCGGIPGASDRFAAALWGIDHLMLTAAFGVRGVNLHAGSVVYQPLRIHRLRNGTPLAEVKPLFYAMQVFAAAAANRARLIPSTYLPRRPDTAPAIRTWGLHDTRRRRVRIVAVYKRGPRKGAVVVRVPGGARTARLRRLTAPSMTSQDGISWAGRTYPRVTADGAMAGRRRSTRVRRVGKRRYRFDISPGSAALLTVRLRRRDG